MERSSSENQRTESAAPAVSARDVSLSFGKVKAVDGVSMEVRKGETFGIIGPDGAGKTTLFRLLTSLAVPERGKMEVCGHDTVSEYAAIRRKIGYMPGKFSLYQDLTVEENLNFFAGLYGTTVEENYRLIKDIYCRLEPFRKRRAGKLSGGMKQKLALSCALIHKPQVLFLDEPTTGVDPVSRKEFWDMLARLKSEGITIIVSTPYMDEAARCDRMAMMLGGKFLATDTPDGFRRSYASSLFGVRASDMRSLLQDVRGWSGTKSAFSFGDCVHLSSAEDADIGRLRRHLENAGHREVEINRIEPSVEDCFMAVCAEQALR